MSIRTVIEINHDRLYNWRNHPQDAAKTLYRALCGVERVEEFDLSTFGIKILIQRHHSTKCTVELE